MFWSGNFIVVRELNFLLKEENVTLPQVLEADDILQECKADNKVLVQFLTRPDILAELITLITEEPSASLELAQQYRHASIACEVLTSPLSLLSDRLSQDTAQMNRLCDFINRDPPLNPLLASFFSKTIEVLLERNPKQDWYLYHIVCLRVLDFFKTRRDFLPNLVRHISTSAIADTFKYFIRLDDLFNKIVMEWLEEHQFVECLIQIICGTYPSESGARAGAAPDQPEKGQRECSEKENSDTCASHTDDGSHDHENNECPPQEEAGAAHRRARTAAVAASNAAELLCELIATGCAAEGATARSRTSWELVEKLAGGNGPRALLQAVFTCPVTSRASALAHVTRLLRRLLEHHATIGSEGGTPRSQVELAVAPHLPLLHQALLRDPTTYAQEEGGALAGGEYRAVPGPGGVGAGRIQTAALLAHLACSEVEEVATTMLTLGTPAVLVDMFFRYPHNNFLHATLLAFVRNALANPAYRTQYTTHLLVECDLISKLMDAFEENENKQIPGPRAGYMGHVTLILSRLQCALIEDNASLAPAAPYDTPPAVSYDVPSMVCYDTTILPPAAASRWRPFCDEKLDIALHHFTQPLGGTYPSDNSYEADNSISDTLASYYEASAAGAEGEAGAAGTVHMDEDEQYYRDAAKSRFMELADQRFDDDMWDDAPEGEEESPGDARRDVRREVLAEGSPWESEPSSEPVSTDEGWAQFGGLAAALPPADPFADQYQGGLQHYWPYEGDQPSRSDMSPSLLANNLLTAMSGMSPAAIANIVNANLDLQPLHAHPRLIPDGEAVTLPSADIPSRLTNDTDLGSEEAPAASALRSISTKPSDDTRVVSHVAGTDDDKGKITTEHVTDKPEDNTNASINNAPADVTDASGKLTEANVVLNKSKNAFPKTTDVVSDANESLDCSNSVNAVPVASPTRDEQSISTDSSLIVQNQHLNDITVKLNDICLRDDQPSDTVSPAESVSETVLGKEKVSGSAAEVSQTAER